MFFPTPPLDIIFRRPCADLGPKVWFLTNFGSQLGPQMAPWSAIFGQRGSKKSLGRRTGTLLEPIWARFGTENAQRMHFHWSGDVFNRFWKDFGPIWDGFYMFFHYFTIRFWRISRHIILKCSQKLTKIWQCLVDFVRVFDKCWMDVRCNVSDFWRNCQTVKRLTTLGINLIC